MRRALCWLLMAVAAPAPVAAQAFDLAIRGARVLDGTGNPWFHADVAVRDGRIAFVGRLGEDAAADRVVDGRGLYLAPGFIDGHSHAADGLSDPTLALARPLVAQGITTVVVNPDGGGPADVLAQREAIAAARPAVHVARLVGHGAVRREVIGMDDRAASPEELDRMRALVRAAMEDGAVGLSSGLFYAPGSYAPLDEVVALGRVVADFGGMYASHVRDESNYSIGVLGAVDEVIEVAREAGIPGVVTHIKALGPPVWGFSSAILLRIERAREEGVEVYADQYPYVASATNLAAALVPRAAQAGGRDAFLARLADAEERAAVRSGMVENLARRGGADRIQFRRHAEDPSIEGRTLAAVATERGVDPIDAALALLEEGSPGIVSFNMHEADVERLMAASWTMTASDGDLVPMGEGVPHPRSYGTFPRRIRVYVRERGVTSLPAAVRSMTSLPARVLGLPDRGVIREGAVADLVLFDLAALDDTATFTDPHRLATGMHLVLVDGIPVLDEGRATDARPGRLLSRGMP